MPVPIIEDKKFTIKKIGVTKLTAAIALSPKSRAANIKSTIFEKQNAITIKNDDKIIFFN